MAYVSEIAVHILNSNFTSFIKPDVDNGTPPLYSLLLAFSYLLFTKSLWAAHLLNLFFALGFLWQINKLSKFFVQTWHQHLLFILVLADPVISTQFVLMGYDIAILFFFTWALQLVVFQKTKCLAIPLIFIALLNLRGFSIVISIFIIQFVFQWFYYKQKPKFRIVIPYFIAAFVLLLWLIYHHSISGFYAVAEGNNVLQQTSSVGWILKNILFFLWKILDFNRFILIAVVIFVLLKNGFLKNDSMVISKNNYLLLFSTLIFIAVFVFFFVAKHYPVGHRYFMPIYPLISILLINLLRKLSRKSFIFTVSGLGLLLFFGNYYLYPPKYGNAWDTSLKVLPYFEAKTASLNFITENNFASLRIASFFPETRQQKYMSLDETQVVKFEDFCIDSIDKYDLVYSSNVINSNCIDSNGLKSRGFIPIYSFKKQFVILTLFKNQHNQ